jgi:hypothetical protein
MIESTGDWSGCELEEHIEEVRNAERGAGANAGSAAIRWLRA